VNTVPPQAPRRRGALGTYARALAVPLLAWVLVAAALAGPLRAWLRGEEGYDEAVLQEWLEEARGFRRALPEMVEDYLGSARAADERRAAAAADPDDPGRRLAAALAEQDKAVRQEEIREHLQALGEPPTKMYAGQLPLFPTIFRLEVQFRPGPVGEKPEPIVWDSGLPAPAGTYAEKAYPLPPSAPRADVVVRYQLHAYNKRQRFEQEHADRLRRLGALALAATALGVLAAVLLQRRERDRERQRARAQAQADQAERLLLRAEARHAETERKLLEQRLATQAAERKALELKSQLYASIGIMAGSYAHNIKNLLVRPNDLLHRCLEADGLSADQEHMLREVRETLGTVTERLQQILRTVRRDPSRSEHRPLDLNEVVRELGRTWQDLARDKWKLDLALELADGPLPVTGDASHLQQAAENLLFNARDATFEMRGHLREQARREPGLDAGARRQALIDAAAWRGRVVLRTRREGPAAVLELEDSGAGMTEEVRRRCTEAHFSTKRDNALYEGHSSGMGLGLSFVVAVLEHHGAALEVESAPLRGTTFRVHFPPPAPADGPAPAGEAAERQEAAPEG
jgi:signal transduction histidine kinase